MNKLRLVESILLAIVALGLMIAGAGLLLATMMALVRVSMGL